MIQHFSGKGILAILFLTICSAPALATDLTLDPVVSVKKHLGLDTRVHASNIQVSEKSGKIILMGIVESLAERNLVEEVVKRIVGDKYLIVGLKVNPPSVPDHEIQRNIATSVPAHCQVEIHDLQIDVQNGNVTLRGRTNALHHKTIAEYVATNIRGVKSVINNIQVAGPKGSDSLIRENILSLLNSYLKENEISDIYVAVQDGKVTLKGEVNSYDQERYIREVAQNVPGVVSLKSDIRRKFSPKDSGGRY